MARIENGIPATFRKHMWLILANRSIQLRKLDWQQIVHSSFDKNNQFENKEIDEQIVKVCVIFLLQLNNMIIIIKRIIFN